MHAYIGVTIQVENDNSKTGKFIKDLVNYKQNQYNYITPEIYFT